jgi:hypothetical protein
MPVALKARVTRSEQRTGLRNYSKLIGSLQRHLSVHIGMNIRRLKKGLIKKFPWISLGSIYMIKKIANYNLIKRIKLLSSGK